jgi:L-lactate dehydrogenase complex protein LldF
MRIPLPDLMRRHRTAQFAAGGQSRAHRMGLSVWAMLARRPRLYHLLSRFAAAALAFAAGRKRRFAWLPFAGGWTQHRDLPAPEGRTFQQLWRERNAGLQE